MYRCISGKCIDPHIIKTFIHVYNYVIKKILVVEQATKWSKRDQKLKKNSSYLVLFFFYRESMVLADFYEMDIKLQER